jgi:hypothetical protein
MRRAAVGLLVMALSAAAGVAQGKKSPASAAQLRPPLPPGYAVRATAEGDFDGDGLRETAMYVNDARLPGRSREDLWRYAEQGCPRPPRVLVVKPTRAGAQLWRELPQRLKFEYLRAGEGHRAGAPLPEVAYSFPLWPDDFPTDCTVRRGPLEIELLRSLRALDLNGDGREEIVLKVACAVGGVPPLCVYVYAYRGGQFEEIWLGEKDGPVYMGHCELAYACPGEEIVVMMDDVEGVRVVVYGYQRGKYRLLQAFVRHPAKEESEGAPAGLGPAEMLWAMGAKPLY